MNTLEPIFKTVFGSTWEKLPPVFQKRYSNRPFSNDMYSVKGEMEISYAKTMVLFIPIFRLLGILVPYQGDHIPVKVDFRSEVVSDHVHLDRLFYLPGKKPYSFNSYMQVIKEGEVVECMRYGLGWRTHYFYDGKKIIMQHKRYELKLFGFSIPIPLEILIGKGHAEEIAIDDHTYHIAMSISHRLFGTMYRYSGNFSFARRPS